MAAPVGTHIAVCLKAMRYAMVQFCLVRVTFRVRLANALGYNLRVAFFVAHVFAIRTLHAYCVLEQLSAQCTSHDVVELLCDELVTVEFVNIFLALTNGTFTVQTCVKGSTLSCFLCCECVSI